MPEIKPDTDIVPKIFPCTWSDKWSASFGPKRQLTLTSKSKWALGGIKPDTDTDTKFLNHAPPKITRLFVTCHLWRFYSLLFRGFFVVFSWLFRGPVLSRKTVFGPFSLLFRGFFVAPVLGKFYAYSPWNSLLRKRTWLTDLRLAQEDVNGEKLTVKKWWIFGADFFTVWCRFFTVYRHRIWPGEHSTVQWKWSPARPW